MIHYQSHGVTLHHGDALAVLATLADNSVDAVVTDPPYSLSFMSRAWDAHESPVAFQQWCTAWAAECLRVLKPGGFLLAFGGTRTAHRLTSGIEDAGFEIRDSIAWLYGSGFPKSLDVSKAIDKAAGAEREVTGSRRGNDITGGRYGSTAGDGPVELLLRDTPATPEAARWAGFGTALKPAHEPVTVARKPLQGSVAANVLAWGTGAINIDAGRIAHASPGDLATSLGKNPGRADLVTSDTYGANRPQRSVNTSGRWPANVALDESAAAELDTQSGERPAGVAVHRNGSTAVPNPSSYGLPRVPMPDIGYADTGGASRFLYVAKADADERPRVNGASHPTVKPLALMRWLVRMFCPPGGLVLDPFAGSGTTAEACLLEGMRCVTIEREADYLPFVVARVTRQRDPVAHVALVGDPHPTLFDPEGDTPA